MWGCVLGVWEICLGREKVEVAYVLKITKEEVYLSQFVSPKKGRTAVAVVDLSNFQVFRCTHRFGGEFCSKDFCLIISSRTYAIKRTNGETEAGTTWNLAASCFCQLPSYCESFGQWLFWWSNCTGGQKQPNSEPLPRKKQNKCADETEGPPKILSLPSLARQTSKLPWIGRRKALRVDAPSRIAPEWLRWLVNVLVLIY